jgi:hypothetical protein
MTRKATTDDRFARHAWYLMWRAARAQKLEWCYQRPVPQWVEDLFYYRYEAALHPQRRNQYLRRMLRRELQERVRRRNKKWWDKHQKTWRSVNRAEPYPLP